MAEATDIDAHSLIEKGRGIYARIAADLERDHRGEAVAIEVDTEDYFLGKTGLEATEKARIKYPDKLFFVARVGRGPYFSFGSRRRHS